MVAVEQRQRVGLWMLSMDAAATVRGEVEPPRRILGLARGDRDATRIVYIVTRPRFERGATLILHDAVPPRVADHLWLWLPGLMAPREIQTASLRALVPGTGLSYEDARGWIATDKYRFRTLERGADEVAIEAWPQADSVGVSLGVSRIQIRVDPKRLVVTGVATFDAAGNLVRTYEATDFVEVGGCWRTRRVVTHHEMRFTDAVITYRYRALDRPPPPELFRPPGDGDAFNRRFLEWRDGVGLAAEFPDSLPQ